MIVQVLVEGLLLGILLIGICAVGILADICHFVGNIS